MISYVLRRLVQTVIVIIILSYLCFGLMNLMPGDPVELMISSNPKLRLKTSFDFVNFTD